MRRKRSQAIQFGNSFQIRRETPAQVKVASDSGFNSGFLFARDRSASFGKKPSFAGTMLPKIRWLPSFPWARPNSHH